MSIEEYTFYGGLVHGEALREYCDSFRRKMYDCASAIFWMYNDTWPCTRSWTIVDYYLRRTPAFWAVRRAMQPVNVVLAGGGDEIVVFGVNDSPQAFSGQLRYGVFDLSGAYPLDETLPVCVPANASTPLARVPRSAWPDPARALAFGVLSEAGRTVARGRLVLPLLKELAWPRAEVRVEVRDGEATFTSDTFAWGVCLDLDGETPLADNLFDLYPGMPHRIPWTGPEPPRVLRVGNLAK